MEPLQSEMATKAMLLLIKVHHGPLSADPTNLPQFEKLEETAFESIRKFRVNFLCFYIEIFLII